MTHEELKISLDINDPVKVLNAVEALYINDERLLVICDDGDCHVFDWSGREHDIKCINEIYNYMFYFEESLKSIKIPDSVKSIGNFAFSNCPLLESIEIPRSVEDIGYDAFVACDGLEKIVFKDKTIKEVKQMDNYPWGIEDMSVIKCI